MLVEQHYIPIMVDIQGKIFISQDERYPMIQSQKPLVLFLINPIFF